MELLGVASDLVVESVYRYPPRHASLTVELAHAINDAGSEDVGADCDLKILVV